MKKPDSMEQFVKTVEDLRKSWNTAPALFFEEIEGWLWKTEQFVMEQTKKAKDMHDGINHLIEYRLVLQETRVLLAYQGG